MSDPDSKDDKFDSKDDSKTDSSGDWTGTLAEAYEPGGPCHGISDANWNHSGDSREDKSS